MGTEKYTSEIKTINFSVEKVYERLSDLRNIEKLVNPEKIREIKNQIPDAPDIKIENFQATEDACSFSISPIGKVGLSVVDREPNKVVKLRGSEGLPFDFNCWLQFLPVDEENCKVRLTLHAEMNPMIKMMVNKHLKEGVNRIADALTRVNFA
jgi:ribosome-associated toxin RatA of RatAB toxin-antitoxin module